MVNGDVAHISGSLQCRGETEYRCNSLCNGSLSISDNKKSIYVNRLMKTIRYIKNNKLGGC